MLHIETDQQYAPQLCKWLSSRFPASDRSMFDDNTRTIGLIDVTQKADKTVDVEILTVAAFHHWSPSSCEVTIATNGAKKQKCTREFIWTCFDYVFNFAEKTSLYATIAEDNDKSTAVALMLGLSHRGVLPDFFGKDRHAAMWSLTKSEWKQGVWAEKDPFPINITTTAKMPITRTVQ